MPPATNWTVSGALDEVTAAINAGAWSRSLDAATTQELRRTYQPDFEREHDRGTDWHAEKGPVLDICELIGTQAEVCTLVKHGLLAGAHLDRDCVMGAAEFAAKVTCPEKLFPLKPHGKWCRGLAETGSGPLGEFSAALALLVKKRTEKRTTR